MAHVSEKTYRTLYIVAVIIALIMFLTSIFYYVQFRKIEDKEADRHTILMTKNSTLILAIIAALGVAILTVLFFGLPRWSRK